MRNFGQPYSLTMVSKHKDWHSFDTATLDCSIMSFHKHLSTTRKYMHAKTLALLNSKHEVLSWLHDIIRIVLKLTNPPTISLLITK
jgi:hypothetical protein